MVTSDLVYSPAQVTEHRCVELKDQSISEDKKRKFKELKEQFPKVFSLSNEDIGCTQLVTMDINTGDSPPVCQKPYTLPLKHYNWVQQEIETLEHAGVIRKSISPWASPIVIVPKKSTPGKPPCRRMCIDFRKLNDLQPEVHCADSQTGGNILLVPLPKIDEMYGRLKGAKYFTTLDLRSGNYHIGLSEGSKAKTAFITPFGKYQFEVVPFGLAQAPAYFQQLISMVHLPLNKFLKQMTLNNTVNNWVMEIESFKIKFVHIAGKDNILADMLSRLIDIDPDVELQPELKDYKFGHYAFETLPKAKGKTVHEIITSLDGVDMCEINITYDNSENSPYSVKLPLSNEKFSCLQDKDLKVRQLKQKVIQGQYAQFYFIKKGVLYRSVIDNGHKFEAAVVPEDLIGTVLHLGHNQSGHNGYQRTYAMIKHVYYWKGMRKHVLDHCKNCPTCAKQKVQKTQFEKQIFEPGVQPMEFVCIDLIGEFYPPSSKGNRYTLTAVHMLTGFTFCIPIKNKTAQEVVTAWRNHISFLFGVCRKLLTDNGTEFKNDLFHRLPNSWV